MIGAGGIGGYYAAKLLEAGHRSVLTARGAHLCAIQTNGLTVRYHGRELAQRLEAGTIASAFPAKRCRQRTAPVRDRWR
nr:2-dehydropantoate 2-reductase N-terminal domain-containing protein [uncultured Marinobacter sp.]